jgi:hypothetical protein
MSIAALRAEIIQHINAITDETVLAEVCRMLSEETETTPVQKLSIEEKTTIDVGLEAIEQGKVYSSEQADQIMELMDRLKH